MGAPVVLGLSVVVVVDTLLVLVLSVVVVVVGRPATQPQPPPQSKEPPRPTMTIIPAIAASDRTLRIFPFHYGVHFMTVTLPP